MYGISFAFAIPVRRSMNLFKIETEVKKQGPGVRGQGSVVNCEAGFTPLKNFTNKDSCKVMNKHFNGTKLSSILNSLTGFTLIEMMVVVVLMSILVAMAYATLRTPNEKIACKEIYSSLQLAKMQAVSTGDVVVDVENDVLNNMEDVDFPNEVTYLTSAPANEPSGTGWSWQAGGIGFSGDKIVTFTSKGMTADSGSVYLYDVDNPTRICAVAVLATGLVKMSASSDGGASASSWN